MSNKNIEQVFGRLLAGPSAGHTIMLRDVRAGLVYGTLANGKIIFGPPHEFQAMSGESNEALLDLLLPRPLVSRLFEGMIRESLASAHSTATFGRQDTRAWEQPHRYVVDDGEGNAAAAQLTTSGIVGVACCHCPTRTADIDIGAAPRDQQATLRLLLDLPFLRDFNTPITAAFWTERDHLESGEPWFRTYMFGGEIFRRELLCAEAWQREAMEHHDLDPVLARTIVDISRKATPLRETLITQGELALLLPIFAAHREEASTQLLEGGVFVTEEAVRP